MIKQYDSLEQRIAASYYLTMPKFLPLECADCTFDEQRKLYDFIYGLYRELYEHTEKYFPALNEDDAHPNIFNCASYGKPALMNKMRKDVALIDGLLKLLRDIGQNGAMDGEAVVIQCKVPKKYIALIESCGVSVDKNKVYGTKDFFNALHWWAQFSADSIKRFSTCAFRNDYDYLGEVLAPLVSGESGAGQRIIDWCLANGYHINNFSHEEYRVDYVKNVTGKKAPVGISFFGDHNHIGFSMEYRYTGKVPNYCTIRMLKTKEILQRFDTLSEGLRSFIVRYNKKCDNCRYCVQTDKTNTRPKAFVTITHEGQKYALCPIFQGFWFSFYDITNDDADMIIEYMSEQQSEY